MSSLLPDSSLMEDDRAVAPLIGFILLFGMLTIAYAGYQAEIVPQQNQGVEFDHSQDVQSDLQELRASLLDIRATGDEQAIREHRPVRVRLGTQYPTRIITVNPPPPQGSLRTQDQGNITIDNAEVVGSARFTGDPEQNLLNDDHQTKLLVYQPNYHELQNPPTSVFEHSLLYNQFDDAELAVTGQRMVRSDTNTLSITVFDGDISKSGLVTTIDPETLDGPTTRIPIRADAGDEFTITLPSRTPEIWTDEDVLGETFTEGEPDAKAEVTGDNEVTITINDDREELWELQMTRVGIDGSGDGHGTIFSDIEDADDRTAGEGEQIFVDDINVNALNLTRAVPSPLDEDDQVITGAEWQFRVVFTIGDETESVDSGDRYTFAIPASAIQLEADGGEIDWGDVDDPSVTVRGVEDGSTDGVAEDIDGENIRADALRQAVEGESVNLFDVNAWEFDSDTDAARDLRSIRSSINDTEVTELFVHAGDLQVQLEMGQVDYDPPTTLFFGTLAVVDEDTQEGTQIDNGEFTQLGLDIGTENADADGIEVTVTGADGATLTSELPGEQIPDGGDNQQFQVFKDFQGNEDLSDINSEELDVEVQLIDDSGAGECLQITDFNVNDFEDDQRPSKDNGDWDPC